jgi:hypothetical protein
MNSQSRIILLAASSLLLAGCQWNKLVANNLTATMDDQKQSFYEEPSVAHARAGAPALLKLLDGFLVSSPDNPELLERAAELNCGFAMLLIEDEDPEWASSLYQRGFRYAEKLLRQRLEGYESAKTIDDLVAVLGKATKDDVGPIFWAGDCLGGYMNLNREDASAFAEMPRVLAFAKRAMELDEEFFYGGPHMFLGFVYGALGASIGGRPEDSRDHFEKAFAVTDGRFLLAKVYFAKTYCVQVQDRDLYEATLLEVIDAPDDLAPEFQLVNAASKQMAQRMLDEIDELFL